MKPLELLRSMWVGYADHQAKVYLHARKLAEEIRCACHPDLPFPSQHEPECLRGRMQKAIASVDAASERLGRLGERYAIARKVAARFGPAEQGVALNIVGLIARMRWPK